MRFSVLVAAIVASFPVSTFAQDAGFAVMCPMLAAAAEQNGGSIPVPLSNVAEIYTASGFGTDSGMYKALSGQEPLSADMKAGIEAFLADTCDGALTLG